MYSWKYSIVPSGAPFELIVNGAAREDADKEVERIVGSKVNITLLESTEGDATVYVGERTAARVLDKISNVMRVKQENKARWAGAGKQGRGQQGTG